MQVTTTIGVVKFFNPSEGKRFGFLRVEGRQHDIFFHEGDYHRGRAELRRTPKEGDRLLFEEAAGRQGRPKASPWSFAGEMPVRVTEGKQMKLLLRDIGSMAREDLRLDDLYAQEIDCGGGDDYVWWYAIIYRPSTGQIFKLYCSDGESHGWCPTDQKHGKLPEGVTISK